MRLSLPLFLVLPPVLPNRPRMPPSLRIDLAALPLEAMSSPVPDTATEAAASGNARLRLKPPAPGQPGGLDDDRNPGQRGALH